MRLNVRSWFGQRFRMPGGNVEYLFAGGLILLIALALGLTIWTTFFDDGTPVAGPPPKERYKCLNENCGHVFEYDYTKDINPRREPMGEPAFIRVECPKCKQPMPDGGNSGYYATKCKKCGKWFVANVVYQATNNPQMGLTEDIPDNCPECGGQ